MSWRRVLRDMKGDTLAIEGEKSREARWGGFVVAKVNLLRDFYLTPTLSLTRPDSGSLGEGERLVDRMLLRVVGLGGGEGAQGGAAQGGAQGTAVVPGVFGGAEAHALLVAFAAG